MLSEDTLRQWLAQEIDPVAALMSGRLAVAGDQMMMARQLAVLQPLITTAIEDRSGPGSSSHRRPGRLTG